MAAFNTKELIDATRAEKLGKIKGNLKYVLLDKDDTLIGAGGHQPINPKFHFPIMQQIIANPTTFAWTILSSGSVGFTGRKDDPTLEGFSRQIVDPTAADWTNPKRGHYIITVDEDGLSKIPRHGFDILLNKMTNANSNLWAKDLAEKIGKEYGMTLGEFLESGLISTSASGETTLTLSDKKTENPITISIPQEASLTLDINGLEVTLNMERFIRNRAYHAVGDNKFFQLLAALALDHCAIVPGKELHTLGIDIKAPAEFHWVEKNQIFVLDDKPTVIILLQKAGINATRANSVHVLERESMHQQYSTELKSLSEKANMNDLGPEYASIFGEVAEILETSKKEPDSYVFSFANFCRLEDTLSSIKRASYETLNVCASEHVQINEESILHKRGQIKASVVSKASKMLNWLNPTNQEILYDSDLFRIAIAISMKNSVEEISTYIELEKQGPLARSTPKIMSALNNIQEAIAVSDTFLALMEDLRSFSSPSSLSSSSSTISSSPIAFLNKENPNFIVSDKADSQSKEKEKVEEKREYSL